MQGDPGPPPDRCNGAKQQHVALEEMAGHEKRNEVIPYLLGSYSDTLP
jgi:hypothetical protein